MKKNVIFILVITAIVLGASTSALAYKKVTFNYLILPDTPLPRSVESLAILDFGGPDGDKFADSVIRNLLDDYDGTLNGNPVPQLRYFEIIERSRMSSIMKEQNLSASGIVDETSAAELGKVAGVGAVFIGEISHDPKSTRTSEKYEGQDNRIYTEHCVTNETRSSFNGRIIDTETGQVLVVFDKGAYSGKSKGCDDKSPTSHSDQIEMNSISLMASVVSELTGTISYRERELEKIKVDDFKDKAKKAAEMSEDGNIQDAFVIYKSQYDADPYSDQSAYNLGVMHEAVGNYAQAAELYDLAVSLKPDEKDYVNAQAECSRTLEGLLRTQEILGFEYPEYEFKLDAASLARATSATVLTEGGRDKRHQVFDGPGGNGTFRIPGELELVFLEDQGEWVKIALPDGKEGWMEEESIKRDSLKDARQ